MQLLKISLVMLCCLLMAACSITKVKKDPAELAGTLLIFDETSDGTPLEMIYFIHADYIRMDQSGQEGYWLLDRQKKVLYKIDEAAKKVQEIKMAAPEVEAKGYDLSVESSESGLMVEGTTLHSKILLNGEVCANVVSVEVMLPDELQALREFSQMASYDEQLTTVIEEGGCEHALKVAHPEKIMEFGFPVRYWDSFGGKRFLKEYRLNILPKDEHFGELPDWY